MTGVNRSEDSGGSWGSSRVSGRSCDEAVSGFIYLCNYKTPCQFQVFSWLPLKNISKFLPIVAPSGSTLLRSAILFMKM